MFSVIFSALTFENVLEFTKESKFNLQMPLAPNYGIWMILKPSGRQEKMIFHPRFVGQLGKQAMYHIQLKNYFERSHFYKKMSFAKKWMIV
jgi:hypothetical protein